MGADAQSARAASFTLDKENDPTRFQQFEDDTTLVDNRMLPGRCSPVMDGRHVGKRVKHAFTGPSGTAGAKNVAVDHFTLREMAALVVTDA